MQLQFRHTLLNLTLKQPYAADDKVHLEIMIELERGRAFCGGENGLLIDK